MTEQDATFARVARALAAQFPPDWELPAGLGAFALPDREIAAYCRVGALEALRAMRLVISDLLESIENGMYYEGRGYGSDPRRFMLDRAEAYHRLWWVDVFIAVYTRPA